MTTKLGEIEHDVMEPRARARYLANKPAATLETRATQDPGQWLPRLRSTFTIMPWLQTGCGWCEGTGLVDDDDPDEDYFSERGRKAKKECDHCDGEGVTHCEADSCKQPVRRLIKSPLMNRLCCGQAGCSLELIEEVLATTWTNHRAVAASVIRDGGV